MGGGGSKKKDDKMPSPEKYKKKKNAAKRKLGAGTKQVEAAIVLQKNIRIYMDSTRRLLGPRHILTKAFMTYGTKEGPEGFLVGYGHDPARDVIVKKRMAFKEFQGFVQEAKIYGGGHIGTTDVADTVFVEQYNKQNKELEKKLRHREVTEGLRRGSLRVPARKEIDYAAFVICMENLAVRHYRDMGTAKALDKICRFEIIPNAKNFELEKKEQRIEGFRTSTLAMLRLHKDGKSSAEKANAANVASPGKKGKKGKGGRKAAKRSAIQ